MREGRKNKIFFNVLPTVVPINPSAAAFPMPKVVMTKAVMEKIFRYAAVADNEVGGIGFVEEKGEELYISEAFLLPQVASEVEMVLDDMALNAFVGDCENPELIRMQWHSHGLGSVFFSPQDVGTIARYDMPYAVSIVVNKQFDIRCRIDIFKPLYVCLEAVVFVEMSKGDDPGIAEAKAEVDAIVQSVSVSKRWKRRMLELDKILEPKRVLVPIGEAAGLVQMKGGMGLW